MGVKLVASSGGSVELVPTNTASNFTVTVPASTTTMVGTDTTQTLTNKTLTTPNIDSAQFATVSGSAPIYPCRAWVNFNGTGTIAIRASGNVSSITDNGTGDYTVNFTTAMTDANYSSVASCGNTATDPSNKFAGVSQVNSSSARIYSVVCNTSTLSDAAMVSFSAFR